MAINAARNHGPVLTLRDVVGITRAGGVTDTARQLLDAANVVMLTRGDG